MEGEESRVEGKVIIHIYGHLLLYSPLFSLHFLTYKNNYLDVKRNNENMFPETRTCILDSVTLKAGDIVTISFFGNIELICDFLFYLCPWEQGFMCLQGGICLSSMGRPISYERAVAWKVLDEEENAHCICFMFINWSFV
jgi:hypothetical protein